MDKGDFKMDVLEIIEDLFQNHYPCRLNRVYIVNIEMKKITPDVR